MLTKLLVLTMVLLAPAPALALSIGEAMPSREVKMKSVDGSEVTLAGTAGAKGTLVIFSCNACPFVKAWEDRMVALGNEYAKKGIGVIAINANDPKVVAQDGYAEMQQRAKEKGIAYPYVVDETSDVARAFGATRTPEAFLFDAGGKLVYHGAIDDNSQDPAAVEARYLRDALEAVLAGAPVAVADTKAMGCTIKFR